MKCTLEKARAEAQKLQTEKRFLHSCAVAAQARHLAKCHHFDHVEKAEVAGMLHDICRDVEDDYLLQMQEDFGIILNNVEKRSPQLWHAIVGSAYVEHTMHEGDEDIINAIHFHTTARANMSRLEKIVYVSDATSEDRDYPDVQFVRELADMSLEAAMMYLLKRTFTDLLYHFEPLHSDSIAAYNELTRN